MSGLLEDSIDWANFLSRHDLTWAELSYRWGYYPTEAEDRANVKNYKQEWGEGAFIGNGMIGAMISKDSPSVLKWELGRNDVIAGNALPQIDWNIPRVPIGEILIYPVGNVVNESMRLSLWDAEASGQITTDAGKLEWSSYAHTSEDCIVIDVIMEGGEQKMAFGFRPLHGVSPRLAYSAVIPAQNTLPSAPVQFYRSGTHFSIQTFINEPDSEELPAECVVAWKEVQIDEQHKLLYITIIQSAGDEDGSASAEAILTKAISQSPLDYLASHRSWWHDYYPASFVSLPDTRWESIYWIQMYKLACATRQDATIIDNQGPWLTKTPWPGTWWNLNVQLAYSPVYKANRLHLGESLISNLEKRMDTLNKNALPLGLVDGMYLGRVSSHDLISPGSRANFEFGNLTWALHGVWKHYKSTMDAAFYKNRLYPLLRSSINVYLHVMFKAEDGCWHLPLMCSPEYPGPVDGTANPTQDSSYDLALFRWGCMALLEANDLLEMTDPLADKWRDVLEKLTDYASDSNGLMVGADIPFAQSHRHYSHLLAIFPLHLISVEQPEKRELIPQIHSSLD